jgi:hypothetical protein
MDDGTSSSMMASMPPAMAAPMTAPTMAPTTMGPMMSPTMGAAAAHSMDTAEVLSMAQQTSETSVPVAMGAKAAFTDVSETSEPIALHAAE